MAQISLTFPDGNVRNYDAGVTPAEVAASSAPSLAKAAISAQVDGVHWDLQWPIHADARISINTMKDDVPALELIRREGVAEAHEENTLGICGLGAAAWLKGEVVGAFAVAIPEVRFNAQVAAKARAALSRAAASLAGA